MRWPAVSGAMRAGWGEHSRIWMFSIFTAGAGMGRWTSRGSPGRKALSATRRRARSRILQAAEPVSSSFFTVSYRSLRSLLSSAGGSPARRAMSG